MPFALLLCFLALFYAEPATFDDLFRAGLVALQRGELATAASNLEASVKLQPDNGRVWVALAQTYRKQHLTREAEKAADMAAAKGQNDSLVLTSLVIYYTESEQTLKAAGAQAQYAAKNPADSVARERAAALYFEGAQPLLQKAQFAEVISALNEATSSLGKNARIQLALGVAYYGLRRFDEAAEAFFSTIALAPETKQPYIFLGKMLDQIPGRLVEATERFVQYEKTFPSDSEGYLLHAKALNARLMEPETARKLLRESLSINDDDAAAHLELGSLLERLHSYNDAVAEFTRAATLDPNDPAAHYRLSRLYERLGKPDAASLERERHRKLVVAQNAAR